MSILKLEERFPGLWAAADRISIVVLGGLMFWLFSILVLTLPAALAALFATTAALFRSGTGEIFGLFWQTFRRTFVTALALGVLQAAVGLALYFDIRILWTAGSVWGKAAALGFGSVAVVALLTAFFSWPLLAWYPQPLKPLLKRSFLLAAAHPFRALGGVLAAVAVLLALTLLPGKMIVLLPLAGPGAAAAAAGSVAWRVMKRYDPDAAEGS